LAEAKLDYWALGHIHESIVLRKADPFIGYPGNTQGRHINEAGRRGCFLVRVGADGKLASDPEFVATDSVRWLAGEVDVAGLETIDELLTNIEQQMDELAGQAEERPVVTRITLRGRGSLHRSLVRPGTAEDLLDELHQRGRDRTPFVWVGKLVLQTRPHVDLDARRGAKDFLGDLLRLIDDVRRSPRELAGLKDVLSDLYEHKKAKKILASPDEDTIRAYLDEAERRCVDLLLEEDD